MKSLYKQLRTKYGICDAASARISIISNSKYDARGLYSPEKHVHTQVKGNLGDVDLASSWNIYMHTSGKVVAK